MSSMDAVAPLTMWIKRPVVRIARKSLMRYARGGGGALTAGPAPVTVVLSNAFGMGGTIRTSLNLAEYLSSHRPVEIVSVFQHRDRPFFDVPPGVPITVVQDRRPGARVPRAAAVLKRRSSVLMHPAERTYGAWSLWTDVRFARMLRRHRGVLITTRPGLNILLADISPPAVARIGQEHMHLRAHAAALRRGMLSRYPRLDTLVVLTESDRLRYERRLRRPMRIDVVPNGVRRLDGPPADLDARLVFSAGRYSPQKGYDLLIAAYARIAARHSDWHLRICGGGPLKAQLKQLVDDHGIGEAVTLAPRARNVAAEMARASIFVLSSRFEGFPLVLLEAMSKGMAVVAYDCPTGPSDVIEDGHNGLLVPAQDVHRLADAIERLIVNRQLRHRLGAAAAETAQGFAMEVLGPRWDALLEELAACRR